MSFSPLSCFSRTDCLHWRRWSFPIAGFLLLALALSLVPGASSAAEREAIVLDGTAPARKIGTYIYSIADPEEKLNLETVRGLFSEGKMTRRTQQSLDFGHSQTGQWIAIPLTNPTDIDITYLLSTNWPFINALEAFLIVDGRETEKILDKQPEDKYHENYYSGVAVASSQFLLPPNSDATIFAKFKPFAFGILPLSLETATSAYEVAVLDTIGYTAFYSAVLAGGFVFLLFVIAIRHAGGLYFLGIILSGLLINAQLDGFFFRFLWPNAPLWDRVAPFTLLCVVNFTSFALAAYMFRSAKMWRLARWMRIAAYVSLIPFALLAVMDAFRLITIGYLFLITAMAALFYAIIVWTQLLPAKRQMAFILGTLMLVIVAAIVFLVMAGYDEVNVASHSLIKLLYVVMILATMISYATHISALNRDYATSLERELELARNEAKMNADLLDSERKFAEAQDLVAKHKHRLATTSHDLKQPIASLRLTLDAMARSGGKEVENNVARAFDYLEDLVNENLQADNEIIISDKDDTSEKVSLDLLFETTVQMFHEEAVSKGISLNHQPSDLEIEIEVIPLMRILNNLVSNSVKHTISGQVQIRSLKENESVIIEVADTGPGMSGDEIEKFSTLYEKGEASEGSGLGLPICFDLAERLGMELSIRSEKGKGSQFRLTLPSDVSKGETR